MMYQLTGRSDAVEAIGDMYSAIERFGRLILRPLIELYKVPFTSVHIFYDWAGPLIAFNRNGSLFLNARYYIAWHDLVSTSVVPTVLANGVNRMCSKAMYHKRIHPGEQEASLDMNTTRTLVTDGRLCSEQVLFSGP
jgi:hypothetical protein